MHTHVCTCSHLHLPSYVCPHMHTIIKIPVKLNSFPAARAVSAGDLVSQGPGKSSLFIWKKLDRNENLLRTSQRPHVVISTFKTTLRERAIQRSVADLRRHSQEQRGCHAAQTECSLGSSASVRRGVAAWWCTPITSCWRGGGRRISRSRSVSASE